MRAVRKEKEKKKTEFGISCCNIVCRGESLFSFEVMGGLDVVAVRGERIPLLWSRVRERTLAKGFGFNMGDAKCPCVCRS